MSKSRGNVVNPDDYVRDYGADTVRGYLMFLGPWEQGGPWDPSAIEGISRFLHRTWRLVLEEGTLSEGAASGPGKADILIERRMHQLIIRATEGLSDFRFNTVIAGYMEFANLLSRERGSVSKPVWRMACRTLLQLMAPIFPHITEELWHRGGEGESIHCSQWPVGDLEKAKEDMITIVIQVNGKLRGEITAAPGTPREEVEAAVRGHPAVGRWCDGKDIRKMIVVPDKLVNVVV
jgi:leucyl-tRNA synthetase